MYSRARSPLERGVARTYHEERRGEGEPISTQRKELLFINITPDMNMDYWESYERKQPRLSNLCPAF